MAGGAIQEGGCVWVQPCLSLDVQQQLIIPAHMQQSSEFTVSKVETTETCLKKNSENEKEEIGSHLKDINYIIF